MENIGSKIKFIAVVFGVISLIAFVVFGIVLLSDKILMGLIPLLLGPFLSWVGTLVLYGFGQLVENSDIIASNNAEIQRKRKNKTIAKQNEIAKKNIEDESFENDEYIDITCPTCGEDLSYHKFEFTNNDELICPKCGTSIQTEDYLKQ